MSTAADVGSVTDSDFASGSIADLDMESDPDGPMFPLVRTYVVLSIDPVATLASLDDPEVTAVTSSLHPKKYVGFVKNTASAHIADAEFMAYQVELLRPGPTPKDNKRFIEPDMCIAVLPNTATPQERPPLQPTVPLPWPDCYHSSFDKVIVRVVNRRAHTTGAVELPSEEMKHQIYSQILDQRRRRTLREAHNAAQPHHVAHNVELPQTLSNDERHTSGGYICPETYTESSPAEDARLAEDSNAHDRSGEAAADEHAASEEIRDIVALIDETQPSNTMPLAVMTYDLSTTEAVSDPRDFREECRVLRQLESDHHARNKAKTAAAIERARKVDDEAFASMSRPQRENESVTDRVPAELASPSTQIKRPSVWTTPKRSVIAIRDYFDEHPFCGEAVDRPLTIMTVVKRLGDKLSNLMKHCACGMLGPVERRSSEFGQQPEKISPVLNEKETTIDPQEDPSSPSAANELQTAPSSQQTKLKSEGVYSQEQPYSEPVSQPQETEPNVTAQSIPESPRQPQEEKTQETPTELV